MPDNWSRRALLASPGAAALAGCSGGPGGTPASPTPTDTPDVETPIATGTPTPESDPTPEPPGSVDAGWPLPAHDPGRSNYAPESAGPTERVAELWSLTADAALSAPVVADGTVFVGSVDGDVRAADVRAADVRTGEERWHHSVGGAAGPPRATADAVYVPTGNAIHALSPDEGTGEWQVGTGPLGDFVVASHGLYFVGAEQPTVVCLDHDGTGRLRTEVSDPWGSTI